MAEKILLLGFSGDALLALAKEIADLGYLPAAAEWRGFSPRALGRDRPDMILVDMDSPDAVPAEELCRASRLRWGDSFPVAAVSEASKFQDVSLLLEAGVSGVIPKNFSPALLQRKLSKCFAERIAAGDPEDPLPESLVALFSREGSIRLGDLVSVYAGATPRKPAFRRMAPPDRDWRGVTTAEVLDRFRIGKPTSYLRWNRMYLFRLPGAEEYSVDEKVILRRAGPPLVAAVDRSGLPAGSDVYALVPREGVRAGFVACLLNSRIMDFYFNRIARVSGDGRLRPEDIRDAILPRPAPERMEELDRIAVMLAHYGANPASGIDKQSREQQAERMEEAIFELYGADAAAQSDLAALHF